MGILDLLNGIGQADAAPWMDRLRSSGAGQGMGGMQGGGLQDFLQQLAGGGQGGSQSGAAAPQVTPPQGGGTPPVDLTQAIMAYLQQQRR